MKTNLKAITSDFDDTFHNARGMGLSIAETTIDASTLSNLNSIIKSNISETSLPIIDKVDVTTDSALLKESEATDKKNKIIVIAILSGIGLAISIVAYLAFRKK